MYTEIVSVIRLSVAVLTLLAVFGQPVPAQTEEQPEDGAIPAPVEGAAVAAITAVIDAARETGHVEKAEPAEHTVATNKVLRVTVPNAPPAAGATLAVYYHGPPYERVRLLSWAADGKGGGVAEIQVPDLEVPIDAWPDARPVAFLFVYTAPVIGTPAPTPIVYRADVSVTSPDQARWFAAAVVAILYLAVAIGLYLKRRGTPDHGEVQHETPGVSLIRSLSPLQVIRTPGGMASLSNFQTLFFTLIIGALLSFALWTTHSLSDLSDDVMILLGIAGGGAIFAKGVDANVGRLSGQNWAFLKRLGWLSDGSQPVRAARITDLVMRDGRVDVFRFQNLLFTFIVGISLFMQEVGGLKDYDIPPAIFGLLGLSQVAYVGGKAIGNDLIAELEKALTDLKSEIQTLFAKASPAEMTGTPADQLAYLRDRFPGEWQAFKVAEQTAQELTKAAFPMSHPANLTAAQLDLSVPPPTSD